jgi:hypothetical protein
MSFSTRLHMCFQHDSAPQRFGHEVCQRVIQDQSGRWTGRGREAPFSWPPCSPDFNTRRLSWEIFENQDLCHHSRD